MNLAELKRQWDEKVAAVRDMFNEGDEKHGGKEPPELKERIVATNKEIEELEKRIAEAEQRESLKAANEQRYEHARKPVTTPVFASGKDDARAQQQALGLADTFINSPEWKGYFKDLAPTGQINGNPRIQSPAVMVKAGFKTLITGLSSTSAGTFVVNEQTGIYEPLGRRPLNVLDIVSKRTTGSDALEFVRQTSRVNAAAPVAEATAASGSSGVKPEGGMAFERITLTVKTIAEWVPATKRSLADAGQMRGIIEDELRADLMEEVEDQILTGDGVGENFEGIDAVAGTQDQAWDTNLLTTTRKARTLVRAVGREMPSAYVLNPTDWQTIDLLQDNEARYFFGGPSQIGTPRLWGLPVVESEAQPVGFGWVADWSKAVLWDREQTTISVSDSHSDFFIRNLVAILGELRAAFAVVKPVAFVEMDLTA